MKYSKWIGLLAAAVLVFACYSPWVYLDPIHKSITGFDATGTNYGKPGLLNMYLTVLAVIFFIIPAIGAKRANIFVCALNLAWSARNFIIISMCNGGECPQKKYGIYLMLFSSMIMLLMALFTDVKLKPNQKD